MGWKVSIRQKKFIAREVLFAITTLISFIILYILVVVISGYVGTPFQFEHLEHVTANNLKYGNDKAKNALGNYIILFLPIGIIYFIRPLVFLLRWSLQTLKMPDADV